MLKINFLIFVLILFAFNACVPSEEEDDNNTTIITDINGTSTPASATSGIHIKAAVYSNNNTANEVNDDTLYIYFDRSYDFESVKNNVPEAFIVDGNGSIGSNYNVRQDNNIFYRLKIEQSDSGTLPIPFNVHSDKINLSQNIIHDINGEYAKENSKVMVENFNFYAHLLSGLKNEYICLNNDLNTTISCKDENASKTDGYYANKNIGKTKSFTTFGKNVIDNVTKLVWQKEDDNVIKTYEEAENYCNSYVDNLNIYTNWRLPTLNELISITNKTNPLSLATYNEFINTKQRAYFSQTKNFNNDNTVWAVDFSYGNDLIVDKNSKQYVRCVHNEKSEFNPSYIRGYFGEKEDNKHIILDTSTSLIWNDMTQGKLVWKEALSYCENFEYGYLTNWRLANYNELHSLVDLEKSAPSINNIFEFKPASLFWTSSINAKNNKNVWVINFGNGEDSANGYLIDNKNSKAYVRCVHSLDAY